MTNFFRLQVLEVLSADVIRDDVFFYGSQERIASSRLNPACSVTHCTMKKETVFRAAILLVLFCAAIWAFHGYTSHDPDNSRQQPEMRIEAADLYQQYVRDEKGSDRLYLNQVIAIRGTILSVRQNDTSMSVEIGNPNIPGRVRCGFSFQAGKAVTIPDSGSLVEFKGKCRGFLMGVILVDCDLEKY
jgi:hypothetical protein